MKKTLISTFSTLAAVVTVFLFTANTAEARGHSHGTTTYVSHYTSCGCPVYMKKVFWKHDCYGKPIYKYYKQPVSHRCNSCNHNSRYNKHNNSYHKNNRSYNHKRYNSYKHYNRSRGCSSGVTYRR